MNLINYLPLFFVLLGLISFTIGSFLINKIFGIFILGLSLIITGLMLIPIKLKQ